MPEDPGYLLMRKRCNHTALQDRLCQKCALLKPKMTPGVLPNVFYRSSGLLDELVLPILRWTRISAIAIPVADRAVRPMDYNL